MKSLKSRRFGVTLLAVAITTSACDDGPAEPGPEDAPDLPPIASMQVDMTIFNAAGQAAGMDGASSVSALGVHFVTAAATVTLARAATVLVMTLPVAVFAAAASEEPVYDSNDEAFHWRYSLTDGEATFEADLSGYAQGVQSIWAMRVSASSFDPPLNAFLWYDGRANLDGTGGEWHIYSPDEPQGSEILQIEWTHPDIDTWSLTFTNVNPAAEQMGDELTYEVDGDIRVVRFTDFSASTAAEIQWNAVSGVGYIEATNYNQGERACWDDNLDNVACS